MSAPVSTLSSSSSSSSNTSNDSTDVDGRAWKKLSKQGARFLGICALVAFSIIAIAALAIGITALVNPAGLAAVGVTVGVFITAGLTLAAENSMAVLIVGSIGVGLLGLAGVITLIAKGALDRAS